MKVLFSDVPKELGKDDKETIQDIASYVMSHLGFAAIFVRASKLAEQILEVDALVVFPGRAENEEAMTRAVGRNIPIIRIPNLFYSQATMVLSRELLEIELKKNP